MARTVLACRDHQLENFLMGGSVSSVVSTLALGFLIPQRAAPNTPRLYTFT